MVASKNLFYIKGKAFPVYRYNVLDKLLIILNNFYWKWIDIFSLKFDVIANIYETSISKEYEREIDLFELSNSKNILHVGCGSYPITAITFSELNGSKIVGIDSNLESVKRAQLSIKKKNIEDKITIKHGNGADFPLDGFDTVIISSCSIPKTKILQNVFENAKPNSKIIVREQYGPNKLIYDCIKYYRDVELVKKINNRAYPTALWESFYLLKK